MTERLVSKLGLAVKGVICALLAGTFVPMGLMAVISLVSGSYIFGSDPDGGDKVMGSALFFGFIGLLALISLVRTILAWRKMRKGGIHESLPTDGLTP